MLVLDRVWKLLGRAASPSGSFGLMTAYYAVAAVATVLVVWSSIGGAFRAPRPLSLQAQHNDTLSRAAEHSDPVGHVSRAQFIFGVGVNSAAGQIGTIIDDRAPTAIPRERHKRPDYMIESPDILSVVVRTEPCPRQPNDWLLDAINGEHLVDPDGNLELCEPVGTLHVAGLTPALVQEAIADRLEGDYPRARVAVSVFAQNSKVVYVILDGLKGDCVMRMPLVADETARDALANVETIREWSAAELMKVKAWVARPAAASGTDTILPVDLADSHAKTNCALHPGDRIFVVKNPSDLHVLLQALLR